MALKPRILIVDEHNLISLVLRKSLQDEPYELVVARNREDAVRQLMANEPLDLIIADGDIAQLKGTVLIELRDSIDKCRETAIIILTSRTRESIRAEALEQESVYWLSKPYRKADLVRSIEWLVRQRSAETVMPLARIA